MHGHIERINVINGTYGLKVRETDFEHPGPAPGQVAVIKPLAVPNPVPALIKCKEWQDNQVNDGGVSRGTAFRLGNAPWTDNQLMVLRQRITFKGK
jgi:hypothetical protein